MLGTAATAQARTWPSAGGWDIAEQDDGCVMALEYEGEGETVLGLLLFADGRVGLAVGNDNWSVEKDAKYSLSYRVDGTVYDGGTSLGTRLETSRAS
jgi:hypothetical protein